ncbi:putative membrane protein [Granulicatella balaenopterae]|uniref:Putative membrane protein n=1 Tax=Granulicatella balaenopterae TaxID=137733 RepID=A0A1H9NMM2_9LACT|nr:YhgE/Pip domain-containing protein [Granulicatella balaenopterae]SER37210.1 putative membrane protein [Granulicatella balaenopterae]
MKHIFQIFKDDLTVLKNNVITLIVVIGIVVVPSLYAWFNIAASWDPYSKTDALKVAISSNDTGYTGELVPVDINIGDKVMSSLRENDKLHWVFTKEDDAVEGVKSGKYYAALIIPEDFSENMMSLFTTDMKHPEISYYYNEKKNAIAPKITDKGASGIQSEINKVFISTISDAMISSMKLMNSQEDNINPESLSDSVLIKLKNISKNLTMSADTLAAFKNLSTAGVDILNLTGTFSENAVEDKLIDSLNQSNTKVTDAKDSLVKAETKLDNSFNAINQLYTDIQASTDSALAKVTDNQASLVSALNTQADKVNEISKAYKLVVSSLEDIKKANPELNSLNEHIDNLIKKLDVSIKLHDSLYKEMTTTASNIDNGTNTINTDIKNIDQLIAKSNDNLQGVITTYKSDVEGDLNQLSQSLIGSNNTLISLLGDMKTDKQLLQQHNTKSKNSLSSVSTSLNDSEEVLRSVIKKIDTICNKITSAQESGDYDKLEHFLSGDTEHIGEFISAPVQLKTEKIYPIENYGSQMAPFYTTLSIWVGGVVLVAVMLVEPSSKYKHYKDWEKYFGRYLIFLILGLLQTTLIMLGDLYFLGIQCINPWLFLVAGWISSFVYVHIIYTLTVSFGDVGKAICVILLVMQVAGTGGTFPIECAPVLFQKIYPLLPFTHSMNAMRECIGGFYSDYYIRELLNLLIFLIPSLLLGLVLRKPVIKLNELFIEELEDTKIM